MKFRQFLSVVPREVQLCAMALVYGGALVGLVAGYFTAAPGAELRTMAADGSAALAGCVLAAIWLLCVGFVFADARRRAMPPVAWTLVAVLMPNLLGFLLYFVMRKPLTVPCPSCNRPIPPDQPFCSWCGTSRLQPLTGDTASQLTPPGLDSINTARVHIAS
jgi:zinc-ribbon domain/Phospholipase_D-nuclease N-terminal